MWRVAPLVVLMLVVLAAILGVSRRSSEDRPPGYVIAAFDRTGSTERDQVRSAQLREIYSITDIAHDHRIPSTLWAMDNEATPIFDGGVPPYSDDDDFINMVKKELGLLEDNPDRNAQHWRIARPGVLLEHALSMQSSKPGTNGPICLFISTDGAAEDPKDRKTFFAQAQKWVVRYPKLYVVVSGISSPKDEARWAEAFAALGDRYSSYPIGSFEEALNHVRSVMYGDIRTHADSKGTEQ